MASKATQIRITLVRSPFGRTPTQFRTLEALGLRRTGRSRIHADRPEIRGMIDKVQHLVKVEPV